MKCATDKVNPNSSLPNRLESRPLLSGGERIVQRSSHMNLGRARSTTQMGDIIISKRKEKPFVWSRGYSESVNEHTGGNSKNNPIQRRCPGTSLIRTTAAGHEAIWYLLSYSSLHNLESESTPFVCYLS
ncbi:hypothetical protein CEXT_250051 [Caerostris extrusa]|uniref:Uncharacterized protein n=1 Tax=Caerostris extrusa TaxID=172846 RepID=A0AAV4XGT2_CAEEX|nr:hypothetical protein CEXT_250051 [Caerostris extrusa]